MVESVNSETSSEPMRPPFHAAAPAMAVPRTIAGKAPSESVRKFTGHVTRIAAATIDRRCASPIVSYANQDARRDPFLRLLLHQLRSRLRRHRAAAAGRHLAARRLVLARLRRQRLGA